MGRLQFTKSALPWPFLIVLEMIITSHNSSNSPAVSFSTSLLFGFPPDWNAGIFNTALGTIFTLNGILTSPVEYTLSSRWVPGSEVSFLRDDFSLSACEWCLITRQDLNVLCHYQKHTFLRAGNESSRSFSDVNTLLHLQLFWYLSRGSHLRYPHRHTGRK